ncbi:MAG: terminase small subunit [Lawsonibacter sp.]
MKHRLTRQQEAFMQALVQGKDPLEAYRAAYQTGRMKDETVDRRAHMLLKNEKMKDRYQKLREMVRKEEAKRDVASADDILEELSSIGMGADECDDERSCTPGVRERLKALELLGKHYKLFTEQEKPSGETGVRIFDDLPGD